MPRLGEAEVEAYLEAGRIAERVLREGLERIREGAKLIDICEYVESRIRGLGGEPAFPCNISINEVAAHYTPLIGDEARVPRSAVVKLDVGVHINGYIADTAATVDLSGSWGSLLEAARAALEAAIRRVAPGAPFAEVGRVIEAEIRGRGFKPIANLSGHSLGRYLVHAGESIPNIYEPSIRGAFEAGKAYAIEPFATSGAGYVVEGELVTIYSLRPEGKPRRLPPRERRLVAHIASRFRTLPFTERWLDPSEWGGVAQLRMMLRKLKALGVLQDYPVLVEAAGGVVAQFEHTVLVLEDRVIVTTAGGRELEVEGSSEG